MSLGADVILNLEREIASFWEKLAYTLEDQMFIVSMKRRLRAEKNKRVGIVAMND